MHTRRRRLARRRVTAAIRIVRDGFTRPEGGCCGELLQSVPRVSHPGCDRLDGWNALSAEAFCLSHEGCARRRTRYDSQGDGIQTDADHHEPFDDRDSFVGIESDLDRLEGERLGVFGQAVDGDETRGVSRAFRLAWVLVCDEQIPGLIRLTSAASCGPRRERG